METYQNLKLFHKWVKLFLQVFYVLFNQYLFRVCVCTCTTALLTFEVVRGQTNETSLSISTKWVSKIKL